MRLSVIVFCLAAAPALAAEWQIRPGDAPFSADELSVFLRTAEIRFYDGGRSEYGEGGAYAYIFDGGDRAEGRYQVEPDGSVCVDFNNGWSRCDLYVRNGDRVLLIDQKGDRYPLR